MRKQTLQFVIGIILIFVLMIVFLHIYLDRIEKINDGEMIQVSERYMK